MRKPTTKSKPAAQAAEVWADPLLDEIRPVVRDAIASVIDQELRRVLGAGRYARSAERIGYRHGTVTRSLGTPMGMMDIEVPRARLDGPEGTETEWRSQKLPRHARRLRGIDKALISVYLSGTNQRRVEAALRPILKGLPMSKSTVSRLAARLGEEKQRWLSRDLGEERVAYVYLDGIVVKVRRDGRVVKNPVLLAIGVRENGEKVLLTMQLVGAESTAGWQTLLEDLVRRGLKAPVLCVIDGNAGLRAAIREVWPAAKVQRCTVHKLRNLQAYAPRHAHEVLSEDFNRIVRAESASEAKIEYNKFLARWRKRCAAVATSLEEASDELLTFYGFPQEQWKSLRSTNLIERLNGEMRRRIKTQGAWSSEEGVLNLMYGLFASGMIRLRKIDGWKTIPLVMKEAA